MHNLIVISRPSQLLPNDGRGRNVLIWTCGIVEWSNMFVSLAELS